MKLTTRSQVYAISYSGISIVTAEYMLVSQNVPAIIHIDTVNGAHEWILGMSAS